MPQLDSHPNAVAEHSVTGVALSGLPVPSLDDTLVCYAANAVAARGGQGEFLRQMMYALDRLPQARILSRCARALRAGCIDVPFEGW
jgi:hypothetical protein